MKKRVDSLARIGRLAAQMHELGRWRLSAIAQEEAHVGEDLSAVYEALESGDIACGPLAGLGVGRIRALQRRLDSLKRETERASVIARSYGLRAKLAERAAEAAGKVWREKEARKALAELIERTLPARDTSQG